MGCVLLVFFVFLIFLMSGLVDEGMMNRIAIDIANAITPPNLLGIDRRIAYANRKYHSG